MIVLAFVVTALVIVVILGGDLRALADVKLHWWGLALVALAAQVAGFSGLWAGAGLGSLTPIVFVSSLALLVIVAARNWRLPG